LEEHDNPAEHFAATKIAWILDHIDGARERRRHALEAVGTQLRVYINDSLILEAADASHDDGRYGPVMYRAGVEYDDILAVEPRGGAADRAAVQRSGLKEFTAL